MFHAFKISRRISKASLIRNRSFATSKDDIRYQIWIAEKHELEAPPFPTNYEWFNVKTPISFTHELKGKIVVVDFFTYCCINCLHVLPDLHFLKEKYKNNPAISFLGIHSPKFAAEKDSRNLRNALLKYNIEHPVVNDVDKVLWQDYGAKVWPSMFVIAPTGNIIFKHLGEGGRESVDQLLETALEYYKDQLDYNNSHIQIALEREKYPNLTSPLRFPGKITIDRQGKRLFIADSGNNRIIVTDLYGKFLDQVGSMNGFYDGSFDNCAFRGLQGLSYDEASNKLFVADTENHAIRTIDFDNKEVKTIAGNGVQGNDIEGGKIGRLQLISSPWDIAISPKFPNLLYIAMAGTHQIWTHNLENGVTVRVAGNGQEMNLNNKVKPINAAFAQPSGLVFNTKNQLVIADSESSSIRMVDFEESWTSTIVGGDANRPDNLFEYGDVDAEAQNAKLQHPLGVAALKDDLIAVADTYNHKIKIVDTVKKTSKTFVGTGTPGFRDGDAKQAMLYEPSGLCYYEDKLYIADTNNCAVRVLDLQRMILETVDCSSVPYNKC